VRPETNQIDLQLFSILHAFDMSVLVFASETSFVATQKRNKVKNRTKTAADGTNKAHDNPLKQHFLI
jgi:hypothetical protein